MRLDGGYNSCEEADFEVYIPDDEMSWLERNVVFLINMDGNLAENVVFPAPVTRPCNVHELTVEKVALVPKLGIDEVSSGIVLHTKESFGTQIGNDECRTKISTDEIMGESLNFIGRESSRKELALYSPVEQLNDEEANFVPSSCDEFNVFDPVGGHFCTSDSNSDVSRSNAVVRSEGGFVVVSLIRHVIF
ncbi:glucose-6-phosphate dehydrogenase [Corchorus olitorius]|uniref:Glucose-6-phosphate dehydrogenase n=1 Tax=Corchorus olitorius TaxID=93759 RepID=A0A1R3JTW5_9ROSI|nr:glucose-6-phosphate dehydrogenase [Corchorus olitorius]